MGTVLQGYRLEEAEFRGERYAGSTIPLISELLPLPETPVMQVTVPSGILTSMSCRL